MKKVILRQTIKLILFFTFWILILKLSHFITSYYFSINEFFWSLGWIPLLISVVYFILITITTLTCPWYDVSMKIKPVYWFPFLGKPLQHETGIYFVSMRNEDSLQVHKDFYFVMVRLGISTSVGTKEDMQEAIKNIVDEHGNALIERTKKKKDFKTLPPDFLLPKDVQREKKMDEILKP